MPRTLTKDHLDNLRAGIPPSSACPGMDVAEVIEALVATVDLRSEQRRAAWDAACERAALEADEYFASSLFEDPELPARIRGLKGGPR